MRIVTTEKSNKGFIHQVIIRDFIFHDVMVTLRCNICLQNVEDTEVEVHISSAQHRESKQNLGRINNKGSEASVVKVWLESLKNG